MFDKINPEKIRLQAEKHYADSDFCCSKAIVSAIREHF